MSAEGIEFVHAMLVGSIIVELDTNRGTWALGASFQSAGRFFSHDKCRGEDRDNYLLFIARSNSSFFLKFKYVEQQAQFCSDTTCQV